MATTESYMVTPSPLPGEPFSIKLPTSNEEQQNYNKSFIGGGQNKVEQTQEQKHSSSINQNNMTYVTATHITTSGDPLVLSPPESASVAQKRRRFSMLRSRNASDPQLSLRARQQREWQTAAADLPPSVPPIPSPLLSQDTASIPPNNMTSSPQVTSLPSTKTPAFSWLGTRLRLSKNPIPSSTDPAPSNTPNVASNEILQAPQQDDYELPGRISNQPTSSEATTTTTTSGTASTPAPLPFADSTKKMFRKSLFAKQDVPAVNLDSRTNQFLNSYTPRTVASFDETVRVSSTDTAPSDTSTTTGTLPRVSASSRSDYSDPRLTFESTTNGTSTLPLPPPTSSQSHKTPSFLRFVKRKTRRNEFNVSACVTNDSNNQVSDSLDSSIPAVPNTASQPIPVPTSTSSQLQPPIVIESDESHVMAPRSSSTSPAVISSQPTDPSHATLSTSSQSSPTKLHVLPSRGRSSTASSMGTQSVDDHLSVHQRTAPAVATSRKSFSDLFSRIRHTPDHPLGTRSGVHTPGTPASIGSKSNSLQLVREEVVLPERQDNETAAKYFNRIEGFVAQGQLGSLLASQTNPFMLSVLRSYMRKINFFDEPLDIAFRRILMEAQLPQEAQQIDRFLQAFADRYHECNPGIFSGPDQAHFYVYSLLMLHTDVFNKNIKHKMQKSDYLKNTSGQGIDDDILSYFYDNITYTPFLYLEDDSDSNGDSASSHLRSRRRRALFQQAELPQLKPTKTPQHPYSYIFNKKFDELRPNLKDILVLDDPYNYLGTASTLDIHNLQSTFFRTGVLQIVSARSRPDAFVTNPANTNPNPQVSLPGLVSIKVTKVGLLWRKDSKKKKTRSPWQEWGAILTGSQLYFFRNTMWVKSLMHQQEQHLKTAKTTSPVIFKPPLEHFKPDTLMPIDGAVALRDSTYKKHKHAFLYVCQGNIDEVFLADDESDMNDWLAKLNYTATFRTSGIGMRLISGSIDHQRSFSAVSSPVAASSLPPSSSSSNHPSHTRSIDPDAETGSNAVIASTQPQPPSPLPPSDAPTITTAKETPSKATPSTLSGQASITGTAVVASPLSKDLQSERKSIEQKMAHDIILARRRLIKGKVEDAADRIKDAEKILDGQLTNARHLQILVPMQPKTKIHIIESAERISTRIKWTRFEIWKLRCHRDILELELEEERRLLGSGNANAEVIPIGGDGRPVIITTVHRELISHGSETKDEVTQNVRLPATLSLDSPVKGAQPKSSENDSLSVHPRQSTDQSHVTSTRSSVDFAPTAQGKSTTTKSDEELSLVANGTSAQANTISTSRPGSASSHDGGQDVSTRRDDMNAMSSVLPEGIRDKDVDQEQKFLEQVGLLPFEKPEPTDGFLSKSTNKRTPSGTQVAAGGSSMGVASNPTPNGHESSQASGISSTNSNAGNGRGSLDFNHDTVANNDSAKDQDRSDRSKLRRSLQRTIRESAGHLSHHKSRKGRDSYSSRKADDDEETSTSINRGTGSFVVHGKKASVVKLGSELETFSQEGSRKRNRDLSLKTSFPVGESSSSQVTPTNIPDELYTAYPLSPASIGTVTDDDGFSATKSNDAPISHLSSTNGSISVGSERTQPISNNDDDDDFQSVGESSAYERKGSNASATTSTGRSLLDVQRNKPSTLQPSRPQSNSTINGRPHLYSDTDSDIAPSFSDGRRSPLPPIEGEDDDSNSAKSSPKIAASTTLPSEGSS